MGLFDRLKNKVMDYVDSTVDLVNSAIEKVREYTSGPELVTGNVIDINQRLRERDIANQRYTQSRGIDYAQDYSLPEPREVVEQYYGDLTQFARKSIENKLEAKRRDWDSRITTALDQKLMAYRNNTYRMNDEARTNYRRAKAEEHTHLSGRVHEMYKRAA